MHRLRTKFCLPECSFIDDVISAFDRISDVLRTEAVLGVTLYKEVSSAFSPVGHNYAFVSTGTHHKQVILVMVMCDQEYSPFRVYLNDVALFREKGGSTRR